VVRVDNTGCPSGTR